MISPCSSCCDKYMNVCEVNEDTSSNPHTNLNTISVTNPNPPQCPSSLRLAACDELNRDTSSSTPVALEKALKEHRVGSVVVHECCADYMAKCRHVALGRAKRVEVGSVTCIIAFTLLTNIISSMCLFSSSISCVSFAPIGATHRDPPVQHRLVQELPARHGPYEPPVLVLLRLHCPVCVLHRIHPRWRSFQRELRDFGNLGVIRFLRGLGIIGIVDPGFAVFFCIHAAAYSP